MKPKDLQFKFMKARERLVPSLELRKRYLEASYHGQLKVEKEMIEAHINRLHPPLRRAYLERRLEWLNKKLHK